MPEEVEARRKAAAAAGVERLLAIMAALRDPDGGCPWDLQQDFRSIAPYTIEEAFEVAEAISRGALDELCDELGDLLFQVAFHARLAEEAGAFDFADVADAIADKMVRRHPHVFACGADRHAAGADAAQQSRQWERIKDEERRARQASDAAPADAPPSRMDGVELGLPALQRAQRLQRRAARDHFDWPHAPAVLTKLHEEAAELAEAMAHGDSRAQQAELGDLLFTCVNLARHLQVDPDMALRDANLRFEQRFRRMEQLAAVDGGLQSLDDEQRETLWQRAKAEQGG